MQHKRSCAREQLIYDLRVFDQDTEELAGYLIDISDKGAMIVSESPISPNRVFHLTLEAPKEITNFPSMDIEAVSVWQNSQTHPIFFDTGFRFSSVSEQNKHCIHQLIEQFKL